MENSKMNQEVIRILGVVILALTGIFFLSKVVFYSFLFAAVLFTVIAFNPYIIKKRNLEFKIGEKIKKILVFVPSVVLKSSTIIVLLLLVGFYIQSHQKAKAQWVVTDIIGDNSAIQGVISWAQQLEQAYQQTTQLGQSVTTLKSSLDVYKKISSSIKNGGNIESLLNLQTSVLLNLNSSFHAMDAYKAKYASQVSAFQNQINTIIKKNQDEVEKLNNTLDDSKSNMTDGERLAAIEAIKTATQQNNSEQRRVTDSYQQSLSTQSFYDMMSSASK
jgi:hypothetical protein